MKRAYRAEDWVDRSAVRQVSISNEMLERYIDFSGDRSPIHIDDTAAEQRGYRARVVHGMLLGSLVSAVIGMELPGEAGVLQDMRLQFRRPCYPGDQLEVRVAVTEFFESVQTLVLEVEIKRAGGEILVTGTVRSGLVRP
jgi:3-hydroxybutyryl-CoA dehydratase